ncbi:hypothetical protein ILYODFUR_025881 [Ilyodon furcidens]|uniref:Uncharacterized protein n=1 Tax=Ilyodon furcidens TaxID=33524 RepID=A0ABV0TEK3_9TELE
MKSRTDRKQMSKLHNMRGSLLNVLSLSLQSHWSFSQRGQPPFMLTQQLWSSDGSTCVLLHPSSHRRSPASMSMLKQAKPIP